MKLDTFHYECPRCRCRVQVTPTNENRMVHVVCTGVKNHAHKPVIMLQVGKTPYDSGIGIFQT